MNAIRRENAIVAAVVASVAVHVALMLAVRAQVMTQTMVSRSPAKRQAVVVKPGGEADRVRFEEFPEVAPDRDAPVAEVASMPAAADSFAAEAEDAATAPAIESAAFGDLYLAPSELESPEPLARRIVSEAGEPLPVAKMDYSRPVATGLSSPVASGPATGAESVDAAPPPAPEVAGRFAESVAEGGVASIADEAEVAKVETFTPVDTVLPSVDEKVVKAENAAVRSLLDVRHAPDLATAVSVRTESATSGDWTYFRLTISPNGDLLPVVPKDLVVILDASGSIAWDRITSCREAAQRILRTALNTGDRFNLVAFRERYSYAFGAWQPCEKSTFEAADRWLGRLAAHGRTDVFATIRSVLTLPRDPARPLVAVVVTDGEANAGVSDTAKILSRFTRLNDGLVSIFMYGVKTSSNRELIDVLCHGNRGESFIHTGERRLAGSELEPFSRRFRDPVLSDLGVVFATGCNAESYPRKLKNLARGETVTLVGRIPKGRSEIAFSLKGLNGATAWEGYFRIRLDKAGFDEKLPGVWSHERLLDRHLGE